MTHTLDRILKVESSLENLRDVRGGDAVTNFADAIAYALIELQGELDVALGQIQRLQQALIAAPVANDNATAPAEVVQDAPAEEAHAEVVQDAPAEEAPAETLAGGDALPAELASHEAPAGDTLESGSV